LRQTISVALLALAVAGCGSIEQKEAISKPLALGRPYTAGVGDVVLEMRTAESLPNIYGKADIFGRTRDTGRVSVRFLGMEGDQAVFGRQDMSITSNETTMSRSGMLIPNSQTTSMSGNIGMVPVSATSTTTGGYTYIPPAPSQTAITQSGLIPLSVAPGGSALVGGHRLTFLRRVEGGIEYSVQ